jgi:hypothetical protein
MRLTGSSSTPISSAAQRSNPLRDFRIDRLIEETRACQLPGNRRQHSLA